MWLSTKCSFANCVCNQAEQLKMNFSDFRLILHSHTTYVDFESETKNWHCNFQNSCLSFVCVSLSFLFHNKLCCFQTSLPLASLPLWWWILCNSTSATCRRGKTKLANKSIALPLCPRRQIAYSWLQFNSEVMPLRDKPKRRGH